MLLPRKDTGPSYPSAWDNRVAPYAKVAERERGLYLALPSGRLTPSTRRPAAPAVKARIRSWPPAVAELGLLRGLPAVFLTAFLAGSSAGAPALEPDPELATSAGRR